MTPQYIWDPPPSEENASPLICINIITIIKTIATLMTIKTQKDKEMRAIDNVMVLLDIM